MKNFLKLFKVVVGAAAIFCAGALDAQVRQWHEFAASDAVNPKAVLSLPRLVEENPGGRAATVMFNTGASETVVVTALQDGSLRRLVFTENRSPVVTTPTVNNWDASFRPRAIVRTNVGTLFMVANINKTWSWNAPGWLARTIVNSAYYNWPVDNYLRGSVYVSKDNGATWSRIDRTSGTAQVCYDASDNIVPCTIDDYGRLEIIQVGPDSFSEECVVDPVAEECVVGRTPNPAVVRSDTASTYLSTPNAGYLAIYSNSQTGTPQGKIGQVVSFGAPHADQWEIVEFSNYVDAQAWANLGSGFHFSVSHGSFSGYFGLRSVKTYGALPTVESTANVGDASNAWAPFGEAVLNASGSRLGEILSSDKSYIYIYSDDVGSGDSRLHSRYFLYNSPILRGGNLVSDVLIPRYDAYNPHSEKYNRNYIKTVAGRHVQGGTEKLNFILADGFGIWSYDKNQYLDYFQSLGAIKELHNGNYNRSNQGAVTTYDNSGAIIKRLIQQRTTSWSTQADGVYSYRGPVANFTNGPSGLPAQVAGTVSDPFAESYLPNSQEAYAGFAGFMAAVSAAAPGGQAKVFVTENRPMPLFVNGTSMLETVFGGVATDRVAIAGPGVLSPGAAVATQNEWNGRLLAVAQDGWSSGSPSKTRLGLFVVPTVVGVDALVDGVSTPGPSVQGCSVVLDASVSGEPYAKAYYWWQKRNADNSWPATSDLLTATGVLSFDASGLASIPDYTVPTAGTYRLVVAGVLKGICYNVGANGMGVASSAFTVAFTPPPSLGTPKIMEGATQIGTTSATACASRNLTLTVAMANGNDSDVAWFIGATQVGTGTSLPITTTVTTAYQARYTGATCSGVSPIDFTVTVSPVIGSLSVSRTVSTVSGATLVTSSTADTANGCSGKAVRFTGSATNATTYTLQTSTGGDAYEVGSGANWTVPRLAAPNTLNPNPGFEGGSQGWTLPFGWNPQDLTPAGGAAEGSYGLVGINSPGAIGTTTPFIVDASRNYMFLVAAKTPFPNATRNIRLLLDCYANNRTTSVGQIAISNNLLTTSWRSFGGIVGPQGVAFPANTAYVALRIVMPDGECYIDSARFFQASLAEIQMANVFAPLYPGGLTAVWDNVAGYEVGISVNRVYRMVASQTSGCGTSTVSNLQVNSYPRLSFLSYEVTVGANKILVPDADPTQPMRADVCADAGGVILEAQTSDGSIPVQWYTATDSPNFTTWVPVAGATSTSYYFAVPPGGGETRFKLVASGNGCDFTPTESRVIRVVTSPSPTATLSAPASACSADTITLTASYANGAPTWERSTNGGVTWTPIAPTKTGPTSYQVVLPTNPGPGAVNVYYRLKLTANGCSVVYANGAASGVVVAVNPVATMDTPVIQDGATKVGTTSATVCEGSPVTLNVSLTNGNSSQVEWHVGATLVGTGTSFSFNASTTTIYRATYTGFACSATAPIDFTVTVNPALGAMTVGRTISSASAGSLVPSATLDDTLGCSGNAVQFSGAAANASAFTLTRAGGGNAFAIGSGANWTTARFAASLAYNTNPSFESGATGWVLPFGWSVQDLSGAGGAAHGTRGLAAVNNPGAITSELPFLIDPTKSYYFFAAGRTTVPAGGRNIKLFVDCFGVDRTTPLGGITVSNTALTASWRSYGALVGAQGVAFPANTAYVKLRVVMPDGTTYLDAVRFFEVSNAEIQMANIYAPLFTGGLPVMWDAMAGYATGETTSITYQMTATQATGCDTKTVSGLQATTNPRLTFVGYEAISGSNKILVPDANPVNPMRVDVCATVGAVTLHATPSNNSIPVQWYIATDSPNFTNWAAIAGATSSSYIYTIPASGEARFKLVASGNGCDFTTVESRVIRVVTSPAPSATLSAPASVCSNSTIVLTASYANGTPEWERSIDNGATWIPVAPVQTGASTFEVTAPVVTGANPQNVYYRMKVTANGCADAWANGSNMGVVVSVLPRGTFGTLTISGTPGSSATICPSESIILSAGVDAPAGATFQWFTRPNGSSAWVAMPSETFSTLTVVAPASSSASSAQYMLAMTQTCGGTTDTSATPFVLSFRAAISITQQPVAPPLVCSGTLQSLSFGAPGADSITWAESSSYGGYAISGLAGSTISVPALASSTALNSDPSFEIGVDDSVLQRLTGAAGSSVGWDRTNVAYHGNASAKTVGGAITLLHPATRVAVDRTQSYLVVAALYSNGSRTHSLGVRTYDATGAQIGSDIWLPGATNVSMTNAWKPLGSLVNAGGSTPAFPAGTASVRLLVRLNEGGTTEDGHLDALRIIPVAGDEMARLAERPGFMTLAEYWDERAGRDANGSTVRSYTYTANATSTCASATSNAVTVNALPRPYIATHPAAESQVCSGTSVTLSAAVIGGGTLSYTWQQSLDSGTTWTVIPGANSFSYTYAAPVVASSTEIRFRLLVITNCGTFVTRTSVVTVEPTPAIARDLDLQANACSGENVAIQFKATGGTLNWESSLDGGPWTAITPVSTGDGTWSYTLPTVNGSYTKSFSIRVLVTSGAGCSTATSSTRTVSIKPATAVATQPVGFQTCLTNGSGASLAVAADGTGVSYQWQRSLDGGATWANLPGATSYTYTPVAPNGQTTDWAARFRVVVTGDCGNATSDAVLVTFYAAPAITAQPQNRAITSGQSASFSVTATATGLAYQWEESQDGFTWTAVSGVPSTSATLALGAQTATGTNLFTRYYRVRLVGLGCSEAVSSTAVLTVYPQPTGSVALSTADPACSGATATIQASVTGGVSLVYQWQRSLDGGVTWANMPGATSTMVSDSATVTGSAQVTRRYRVVLTDPMGQAVTTSSVQASWNPGAAITAQPQNVQIASGGSAVLSVVASGYSASYQWETSVDGQAWSQVSDATSSSLTTAVLTATGTEVKDLYYRVVVSSEPCASATSSPARVRVYPTPNASASVQGSNPTCSGSSARINAAISSGVSLTYQWQTFAGGAWADVPGETSQSLYLSRTVTGTTPVAVDVRVRTVDPIGQTHVSAATTVTWNPSPIITTHPVSKSICEGGNTSLSAAFTGLPGTTIQWQQSPDNGATWTDMPGQTATTLSISALADSTSYRLRVSGPGCSDVFSAAAMVTVKPLVAITLQPEGATICSGESVTLTIQAVGSNLSYRWERQSGGTWQAMAGNGPSITLPLTNLGSSDQIINFRVTVTGECGSSVTSSLAPVAVRPGFQVVTQPKGGTICNNTSTAISFTANGAISSILWERSSDGGASWAVIPGATTAGINTGSLASGTHIFRAQITGVCGDPAYTDAAEVVVRPTAMIVSQPQNVVACHGQSAGFEVQSNTDATFQWFASSNSNGPWAVLDDQTQSRLSLSNLTNLSGTPQVNYYRVEVRPTSCDQPMFSQAASLTIRPGTAILTQPANVDTCINSAASTAITMTGENAAISWEAYNGVGWVVIPGATSAAVQVPTSSIGTYQIRAVVTGGCGSIVSQTATVKVSGPSRIVSQPASTTACEGASVTFTVVAEGAALTYRWEQSLNGGDTWQAVAGSNPNLTVIASQNALYRVTVLGGAGCNDSVTSQTVSLTVSKVPQDVPLETPTFASSGRMVYLQVADSGPAYDTVTWTLGSQTASGRAVTLQVPAEPGNYVITVVATLGQCQSVTAWTLGAVNKGNGDVNQSGVVEGVDFARLQMAFGLKAGERGFDAALDLNGDGTVDALDQALLLTNFGNAAQAASVAVVASDAPAALGTPGGEKVAALPINLNSGTPRRRKALDKAA